MAKCAKQEALETRIKTLENQIACIIEGHDWAGIHVGYNSWDDWGGEHRWVAERKCKRCGKRERHDIKKPNWLLRIFRKGK